MKAAVVTGGHLVLESVDADTQIILNSSSSLMLAELGISTGTIDPTNLIDEKKESNNTIGLAPGGSGNSEAGSPRHSSHSPLRSGRSSRAPAELPASASS